MVVMIGVVLWSDAADGKAVFWCEDQGDLAYYECLSKSADDYAFFDAGDMVQFDVAMDARIRKAHNATLIQEQACVGLPESLRQKADPPRDAAGVVKSAEIIPFTLKPSREKPAARPARKA